MSPTGNEPCVPWMCNRDRASRDPLLSLCIHSHPLCKGRMIILITIKVTMVLTILLLLLLLLLLLTTTTTTNNNNYNNNNVQFFHRTSAGRVRPQPWQVAPLRLKKGGFGQGDPSIIIITMTITTITTIIIITIMVCRGKISYTRNHEN